MPLLDLPSPTARALQRLQHDMDAYDARDACNMHSLLPADFCGLFFNEQSPTTFENMPYNPSVLGPLDELQYATCAAGHLQTAGACDGETSKKSPAKKKAPAKKATAVKKTVNKCAAKKPPATLAPASGVVQARQPRQQPIRGQLPEQHDEIIAASSTFNSMLDAEDQQNLQQQTDADAGVPAPPVPEQVPVAFPRLARGGGNKTGVKTSTRTSKEFIVKINEDGFALWEPNTRNAKEIAILKEAIEALPSDAKTCDGTKLHPLLHVSSVCIPMSVSNDINNSLYGHRKQGNKAFGQLLSYLGMRSNINENTQVRTLNFDPEGWNRMGYRLVRGGDTKGGKPEIVYVR